MLYNLNLWSIHLLRSITTAPSDWRAKEKLPFPFLFYVVKKKKKKKNWQGKLRDTEGKGETYLSIKKWEELRDVNSIRRALSEWWTLLLKEERNIK